MGKTIAAKFVLILTMAMANALPSPGEATPLEKLIAAATVLPGDDVRGCCVYNTDPKRCAPTNKGFCRTSADEHSVSSRFHANAKCQDVAACPKK